jgi:superfamily I DNA/RNA helicase
VGPGSKRVKQKYDDLLEKLGPELKILHEIKYEELEKSGTPLLAEAIERMRTKKITLLPGYDGEYGQVKIFTQQEREKLSNQQSLFAFKPNEKDLDQRQVKPKEFNKEGNFKREEQTKKTRRKADEKKNNHILSSLNKDQKKAVLHQSGPIMIIAGPGTGKTRTLTHRIAYLIKEKKIPPKNILALTFTNKAAMEMRERLKILVNENKTFPLVATFHSLCFKILQEQENSPKVSIIDEDERSALFLRAIQVTQTRGIKTNERPKDLLNIIIKAKQQILGPSDELKEIIGEKNTEKLNLLYQAYQKLLFNQNLCDFEDLIYLVVKLLEKNDRIKNKYIRQFKYVFVDEYQDINHGQYRIIQALAPSDNPNRNLCVIGDPDQAIYGFRGSDVRYFSRFSQEYPHTKLISLTKNYRSTTTILDASYQIIKRKNAPGIKPETGKKTRRVYSDIKGLKKISIVELLSERAEAEFISHAIEEMIGGTGHHSIDTGRVKESYLTQEKSFSDFAVLYRTKSQSRIFADVFDKRGVPVQVVSKDRIFDNKVISQMMSVLKIIEGLGSYTDIERVIRLTTPGISRQTVDIFISWAENNKFALKDAIVTSRRFPLPEMSKQRQINFHAFINRLLQLKEEIKEMTIEKKLICVAKNTGLEKRMKNNPETKDVFDQLVDIAKTHGKNASEFFAATALQTDTDTYFPQAEKVSLLTMHAAKGLEFPVVFIAGCEQGYIPFEKEEDKEIDINEERRLFYVAMTRAKERLYLTRAKKRRIFGKIVSRQLSSFIEDIEKELTAHEAPVPKKKNSPVQLELF